ncbi:MAG: hypothetical protein ACJ79K_04840 [Gemmatimonadaceae bacterium]
MPKAVKLSPYQLSDELELLATDFVDPSSGGREFDVPALLGEADDTEFGPKVYDLAREGTAWEKLTVGLRAELSAGELERILPPTSALERDTKLVVSVRCPTTRLRHGVRLQAVAAGCWEGCVTVQRADVAGALELRPVLVRRTSLPDVAGDGAGVARHAGAVIARGASIQLRLDAPSDFAHGNFKILWEDFRQSVNEWRREHASDLYQLEPYTREPVLYLNARYAQVHHVLESRARTGADAVLRDTIAALIAQSVWIQLGVAAMGAARTDDSGEYTDLPHEGWKRDALIELLPRLYPEVDDDGRLQRAASDFRDAGGIGAFVSRLGTVAQDVVGTWRLVESAVRAGEAGRDGEAVA